VASKLQMLFRNNIKNEIDCSLKGPPKTQIVPSLEGSFGQGAKGQWRPFRRNMEIEQGNSGGEGGKFSLASTILQASHKIRRIPKSEGPAGGLEEEAKEDYTYRHYRIEEFWPILAGGREALGENIEKMSRNKRKRL